MRWSGLTVLLALSAMLALSACDRGGKQPKAAAPATPAVVAVQGFQHEPGFDVQGFYRSDKPVQMGNLKLDLMAIGAPSDFQTWESGARDGIFGPIWLLFNDVTSPVTPNDVGHEGHTVTVRVLPEGYSLSPGRLVFRGTDARLGEVVLEGVFDTAALAQARAAGSSDGKPVMSGSLQVGSTRVDNLAFAYWVGD